DFKKAGWHVVDEAGRAIATADLVQALTDAGLGKYAQYFDNGKLKVDFLKDAEGKITETAKDYAARVDGIIEDMKRDFANKGFTLSADADADGMSGLLYAEAHADKYSTYNVQIDKINTDIAMSKATLLGILNAGLEPDKQLKEADLIEVTEDGKTYIKIDNLSHEQLDALTTYNYDYSTVSSETKYYVNGIELIGAAKAEAAKIADFETLKFTISEDKEGRKTVTYKVGDVTHTIDNADLKKAIIDASASSAEYYIGEYKVTKKTLDVTEENNKFYVTIQIDGEDQQIEVSADKVKPAPGNSSEYTLTGTDGRISYYKTADEIPVFKVITKVNKKDVETYWVELRDQDGKVVKENGKTVYIQLTDADVLRIRPQLEGRTSSHTITNVDGTSASAAIQQETIDFLKEVSTTSNFVVYAEKASYGTHVDGNIVVNEFSKSLHDYTITKQGQKTYVIDSMDGMTNKYQIVANKWSDANNYQGYVVYRDGVKLINTEDKEQSTIKSVVLAYKTDGYSLKKGSNGEYVTENGQYVVLDKNGNKLGDQYGEEAIFVRDRYSTSIEALYGSGRNKDYAGLDHYSIILNSNEAKFEVITSGAIVIGTNVTSTVNVHDGCGLVDVGNGDLTKLYKSNGQPLQKDQQGNPVIPEDKLLYKSDNQADNDLKAIVDKVVKDKSVPGECDNAQLKAIVYAAVRTGNKIQVDDSGRISNTSDVQKLCETALKQTQVTSTLNSIAQEGQDLIDSSLELLNETKNSFDKNDSKKELSKLAETLRTVADSNKKEPDKIYVATVETSWINETNGIGYLESIASYLAKTESKVIINVVTKDNKPINLGKVDGNAGYSAASAYIYWNFGEYAGTINSIATNDGTVIAPKATFKQVSGSRDGGVVAKTVITTNEIHQALSPSFTEEEIYSYKITPDVSNKLITTADIKIGSSKETNATYKINKELWEVYKVTGTLTGTQYDAVKTQGTLTGTQ
ncbi:hypothetical protein SAMN02910292_03132, partial [Lachnospiraceae bacterium XBB2008]